MNKNHLYLFIALTLYSCGAAEMGDSAVSEEVTDNGFNYAEMDSVEFQFNNNGVTANASMQGDYYLAPERLNENQLRDFENAAIQKLIDFHDYLIIINNKDFDKEFRKQAVVMGAELFIGGERFIADSLVGTGYPVPIGEYLMGSFDDPADTVDFSITGIEVESPLVYDSEFDLYAGKLSFIRAVTGEKNTTLVKGTANFVVVKEPKSFGDEELDVWEISLGSIEN